MLESHDVCYVFSHSCQSALQHLFVLAVHADADSQLYSVLLLDQREQIVLTILFHIFPGLIADLYDILEVSFLL